MWVVFDFDYGGFRGGVLLVFCSFDLMVKLWDLSDDYKNIRMLFGYDYSVSVVWFILLLGNLFVIVSRDRLFKIWDIIIGFCVWMLIGYVGWVWDVDFLFDGRFFIFIGDDMSVRIWDIFMFSNDYKSIFFGYEYFNECCVFVLVILY